MSIKTKVWFPKYAIVENIIPCYLITVFVIAEYRQPFK